MTEEGTALPGPGIVLRVGARALSVLSAVLDGVLASAAACTWYTQQDPREMHKKALVLSMGLRQY